MNRCSRRFVGAPSTLTANGGAAFFLAYIASNGSDFFFHVLISRILGPETYGALGSILGMITVVTFAAGALQAAVIQGSASPTGRLAETGYRMGLRRYSNRSLVFGALVFGVIALLTPSANVFLHLDSLVPWMLFGTFVGLTVLTIVPQGVLLGRLSFQFVAIATLVGALIRMLVGLVLVELGWGLDGVMVARVLSVAATLAILIWPLRREIWTDRGSTLNLHISAAVLAVAALGGLSALVGIDTVLARHFLPAPQAGQYAAAATAARIVLFLPSAVALLAFPRFSATSGVGPDARRVLRHALVSTVVLDAVALAILVLAPNFVISVLFGSRYQSAVGVVRILAVAAMAMGLVSVLLYWQLARRTVRALASWVGLLIATAVISFWHTGLNSLAWTMVAVTSLTLALLVGAFRFRSRDQSREGTPSHRLSTV